MVIPCLRHFLFFQVPFPFQLALQAEDLFPFLALDKLPKSKVNQFLLGIYPCALEPFFDEFVIDDNAGPHVATSFETLIAAPGECVNEPIV
jgi:hypothetical protein